MVMSQALAGIGPGSKPSSRMKWILKRLTILCVAMVAALGSIEVILRLTRDPNLFLPHHKNSVMLFYPNEKVTPGVSGVTRLTTNEYGCRGPEYAQQRLKLLTVGGSTTACTVLDDTEAWPQLLMDGVNRRAGDPKLLWVTNSGIDGKNSRHHVMHAKYLLPRLPRMDYLLLYAGLNDAGAWLYQTQFDSEEMERPDRVACLIGESFRVSSFTPDSMPWFKYLETWKRLSMLKDRMTSATNRERVRTGIYQDDQLQWLVEERRRRADVNTNFVHVAKRETLPIAQRFYANNLRTIAALARARGCEPIFVSQATQWQGLNAAQKRNLWMGAMDGGTSYVKEEEMDEILTEFKKTMREVAAELKAHFFDLDAAIKGHPEFYYDSCHFNEAGARAVAEQLTEFLLRNVLKI